MNDYRDKTFQNKYPLSSRKPLKKTVGALLLPFTTYIGVLIFFIIARVQSSSEHSFTLKTYLLGISVFVLMLAMLVYLYQLWYVHTYFYNITDEYVIIRKGAVAPKEITVINKRILDINVDQDILDRLFGLYDVHIATAAGESEIAAHIDGVDQHTAEQLRKIILDQVRKH